MGISKRFASEEYVDNLTDALRSTTEELIDDTKTDININMNNQKEELELSITTAKEDISNNFSYVNAFVTSVGTSTNTTLSTSATICNLNLHDNSSGNEFFNVEGDCIRINKTCSCEIFANIYLSTGYTVNDLVHMQIFRNDTIIARAIKRITHVNQYEILSLSPYVGTLYTGDKITLKVYNQTGARGTITVNDHTYSSISIKCTL